VKPIDRFAARWGALLARAHAIPRLRLAVVGGGAGGVEARPFGATLLDRTEG